MGIKRTARLQLEKLIGKFGYTMSKPINNMGMYTAVMTLPEVPLDTEAYQKRNTGKYTLSWVIPPLGPGSGGHLDIFRAISILTEMGIHNKIYICGGNENIPQEDLKKTVQEYYGLDMKTNEMCANFRKMDYSDAVIATSWITAYVIRNYHNCISKFYFVQDFEPYFYPMGSDYAFAEQTYRFGYRGITAGGWLAQKLHDEYGMETQAFHFSYERELYHKVEKKDVKNRIFFYARPYTERRAFDIGIMALEQLNHMIPDLEIVFAGQKLVGYEFGFQYVDMGILQLDQLCDVYSQCDMCLVLSMTNLSLLPMEIMASNGVVVSNKGANNEWMLNDENAVLVDNEPVSIAETMAYYLSHKNELEERRQKGLEYVEQFTWEGEIKKVYTFITESIEQDIERMNK